MPEPNFHVDINDGSVSVRLNASPRGRFYASIFFIAVLALMICGLLFLPGKNGSPSMWNALSSSPVNSGDFIVPSIIVLGCVALVVLLSWRYVISAYPSDETFYCDGRMLTISKVRWLDIHNEHWDTSSYAVPEVVNMRYQAIASARGTSIYGLRFIAGGKTQRVLPGLKPREADKILKVLKSFGADVPDDPKLLKKLAEIST